MEKPRFEITVTNVQPSGSMTTERQVGEGMLEKTLRCSSGMCLEIKMTDGRSKRLVLSIDTFQEGTELSLVLQAHAELLHQVGACGARIVTHIDKED